jgi:hypothetical protein
MVNFILGGELRFDDIDLLARSAADDIVYLTPKSPEI